MFTRCTHFVLIFLLAFFFSAKATHNRAGEITYKRIQPFTQVVGGVLVQVFTYSITVIKYTDHANSGIADRCVDTIFFGDGERGIAPRLNGTSSSTCQCGNFNGKPVGCGEIIVSDNGYVVKKNIYTIIHTYPSAGNYIIRTFDPNRNKDVRNIPNSVDVPFYIESMLIITNIMGANSSPIFAFAPIDKACKDICFEHNPGAFDPDGDSLSYELTTSRGLGGQTVPGYFFPEVGPGGTFSINAVTGLLSWCDPQLADEYNIAFIVKEWRKNTSGNFELIGYVLRDMQVIVRNCPNEFPPLIEPIAEVCVEAGKQIDKEIFVSDKDDNDKITIVGGGGAFASNTPIATLSPTVATTGTTSASHSFSTFFKWQTSCDHIRKQPYMTTFKAQDNGLIVKLVSFQSFVIRVVPPSVKNVTATPAGTTIRISWSPTTCNPAHNRLIGYKVYRKADCEPYTADACKGGVPLSSGYDLVGSVSASTNFLVDDNNNDGLVVGQNYSYIVIAEYSDGSQSFGSSQVCAELKRDVPVITNVDVLSTSTVGAIQVKWVRPLTTPGNLDLNVFKGPYRFDLKHSAASSGTYNVVYSTTKSTFTALEEAFTHTALNTSDSPHEYIIDFFSDTIKIGSSQRATSVWLTSSPSDRRIDLKWSAKTPWNNYNYLIFKQTAGSNTFVAVGSTSNTSYTDTSGLENEKSYCYFIRSIGEYSDTTLPRPLINNSQQLCTMPKDLTPPVTPTLSIDANCPNGLVEVTWTDIKDQSDDVGQYELFYKPTINGEYNKVATIKSGQPLMFRYDGNTSISGCYAVMATDINNNAGKLSPDFCIENCPEFELPNVFSPNGDSINDFYKAIKVRQIKEIELTITDRWGNLVYQTRDPYFHWNGVSIITNLPVSEGTFFYVCDVFEPRLKGIVKRNLRGYVHLVR